MKLYEMVVVALFAALTLAIHTLVPILMTPTLIILGAALKKHQGLMFGVVVGFTTYLLTGRLLALSNVLLLPLLLWSLASLAPFYTTTSRGKNSACLSGAAVNRLKYGIVVLVTVFAVNVIAEILALLVYQYPIAVFWAGFIPAIVGASITAVVVGIVGTPLRQRVAKLMLMRSV